MITLEINNSFSQLKLLSTENHSKIKKLLSYEDNPSASYFAGKFVRSRTLLAKDGHFPTGLVGHVTEFLEKYRMPYQVKDSRVKPFKNPHSGSMMGIFKHDPYLDQQWAADDAILAQRGIISMPTGTGKSMVIALLISKLGLKTLVIVPSLEIKKQLAEGLEAIFGKVGSDTIRIENIDSGSLKDATAYDVLIIDEAHHVAAKTYQKLNKTAWKDIYYRFMLTATPFRNQPNEQLLFQGIAGEVIYELSYKDAVERGYIVPVEAFYIDLPKTPTSGTTWAQVYSELVVNNHYRNGVITGLIETLDVQGFSNLTLVKEVKHGETLSRLSGAGFATGADEDSRQFIKWFNQGKLKSLIGTTGIIGEGVDTKPAEYVIIAGLGKAKSAFQQQVGRAVRTYPGKTSAKIIIFKDPSHKWTMSHFNAQKKILLEEYGVKLQKL